MSELVEYGRDKFGNHENDEEMIKFWEMSGLLEQLPSQFHLSISKHLDEVALYLIELNISLPTDLHEDLDTISFPVIRRIYGQAIKEERLEILDELDVRNIVRTLMITYDNLYNVMISIYGDNKNVDYAAEAVCIVSEQIYRSYLYK